MSIVAIIIVIMQLFDFTPILAPSRLLCTVYLCTIVCFLLMSLEVIISETSQSDSVTRHEPVPCSLKATCTAHLT